MTLGAPELLAYAGALALLVIAPGPVVAALIARAASGGVWAAVPLAAGVAVGDFAWPLVALLGIGAATQVWGGVLEMLRYGGAAMLVWMGWRQVRKARAEALRLTGARPEREPAWDGFLAGVMIIAGNPKAILFYLGVLPGFFDLTRLTGWDMAILVLVSAAVPFLGNLAWAALFAQARRWLADPEAMRRTQVGAGLALMGVGVAVALG